MTLVSLAAVRGATLTATYRSRLTALDTRLPESVWGLDSATITEFAHYLPADLEEYLWFRACEDVETIVYDAGLWLSGRSCAKR